MGWFYSTWSNHYGLMCITFCAVALRIQFVIFFVLKMVKQVKIINVHGCYLCSNECWWQKWVGQVASLNILWFCFHILVHLYHSYSYILLKASLESMYWFRNTNHFVIETTFMAIEYYI